MEQTQHYALAVNDAEIQRLRRQNEALADEAEWLLDNVGIQPGWRVIDVGCGPVGLLEAFAERVGPAGTVVGLDLHEPMVQQARAVIAASGHANVEVIQGDARHTGLPRASFDLVHARLVLINLPRPMHAPVLDEMFALAKPGGLVVLEEIDGASWSCEPSHDAWEKLYGAFLEVWRRSDLDARVGRRLPHLAQRLGLTDVKTKAHVRFYDHQHLWRKLLIQFIEVTRARVVAGGILSHAEIDALKAELIAHVELPDTTMLSPTVTQVWGRKPTH